MYLKFNKATKNNYERLATDYYLESEKIHGAVPKPVRDVSMYRITNEEKKYGTVAEILEKFDPNYAAARRSLDLAYDESSRMISLHDDNHYLIAHATVGIIPNIANNIIKPYMTDIIIKNGDDLLDDIESGIHIRFGIYRKMIEYYEKVSQQSFPNVDEYTIFTYGNDGDFWLALEERGFEIQDSEDLDHTILRFTKPARKNERDISDGGNITR